MSVSSPKPSSIIPLRGAALVALCTVLAACAARPVAPPLPEMTAWETRQEVLTNLDSWGFNGRIAVRNEDDGFNGKLRYQQEAGDFEAVMSGPLGIGTVKLERSGDDLRYTDKNGTVTAFADPDLELKYRFGWDVPLDSLRFWALGVPDPSRPAETELDDAGQVAAMIEQGGWRIVVPKYREWGDTGGQAMPQRLTVSNGETRVTLVIDRWRLEAPR